MKNGVAKSLIASLAASTVALATTLPTAAEIQKNMGMGYNVGNSMEVPNDPTAWGNPYPTQELLDSVKAAGFSTVRIPCAWDSHASNGNINKSWLDSVQTVVNYAMRAGLYTILNIHHEGEGGWFQSNIGTSVDAGINTKMKNYWTQIATQFKDYDEHLIFAGANEPGPNVNTWTSEHVKTLMTYYQTFIDAVRSTGGNNETRTLIIQGLNTDIDKSVASAPVSTFPKDKTEGRLMFEVHYYDPYQYTLMAESQNWGADEMIMPQYYYGADYLGTDPKRNAGYNAWSKSVDAKLYSITHPNEQFAKIKSNYVDKGYPTIVGEFGANARSPELSGSDLDKHKKGRVLWHKDVVQAAKNYGLTPILWDMGNESNSYDNMTYLRRQTSKFGGTMGKVVDIDVINAMRSVYGLGNYVNNGVTHNENFMTNDSPEPPSSSSMEPSQSSSSATTDFATGKLPSVSQRLYMNGRLLLAIGSAKELCVFDLNGNQVAYVRTTSGRASLDITKLQQGIYIAKFGEQSLRISTK
ncbi:MAG: glycoside hydrolase family 5 protein [Fibrobacter sp.]|nr:glycoside hydrolase family 5 protein [Fibrobacter sp.]